MHHDLVRSPVDLDLGSKIEVDLLRSPYISSSICLDETNTMVPILLLYISKWKKLFAVKDVTKKNFTTVTFRGQIVNLRSNLTSWLQWRIQFSFECRFRICFSSNSSRDKGGFPTRCSTITKNSKFSAFLVPGDHNFDPSEKWPK